MFNGLKLIFFSIIAMPYPGLAQQHFSPKAVSLQLFNKYKPVIERKNNALVDNPVAITGDINGDNTADCIVSFVLYSKDGGNLIIGHGSAIYLNTGTGMKEVAAFPKFPFCYALDYIRNQVIYGTEYVCAPPYMSTKRKRKFAYVDGKINEVH